ncbi:phage tail tape measure protein [Pseudomonas sp. NIBR-H-19]|uniref:phage tail tape measure protein n=1 Tax=Pseudomonas sp. NIBR-H-19 TaxID=2901380 RepID=UPI001E29505C|nr:phage tail tape measure protein [Pseudomonas sp. NIBR-H-19]UHC81656.1 phage tail tape measure protein [Pseudomonas sp. NIBR-H-19]
MAQTSRLVLEIDSRDAKQEAADTRRALEALEDAGIRVKPAMDKAGAGIEGAGKSAGKATKSLQEERAEIEHLLESINPLTKKLNDLEKQEAALNKARKSGKIELDTYNEYSARLSATRAELGRFNESLGKTGVSAKQTAAALRGVPAQFTDIAVSLQGGQAPLTVFLQQGGQLKDMFGGIGPAAKALGGYIVGLVNPLTVGAAAAGALGAVFYDAEKQVSAFNKSLFSGTASSGQTAASLAAISKTVSSITGDISEANAAVITLAGSSKLSQTQFVNLAQASASISEFTGKSAAEVAKSLGDIGESATKAAEKISSQYGLLTSAQYDVISALDEQGKKQEALDALSGFLNENAQKRLAAYKASLSDIERDWNNIGTAISNAYSRVKAELFPDLSKEAELIERVIKTREEGGVLGSISSGFGKASTAFDSVLGLEDRDSTDAMRRRLALIKERIALGRQEAVIESEADKEERARIEAQSKWNADMKSGLTGQAKLEDEISKKRALGLAAGRSQVEIDKEVAALREKYEKSLPKPKAYAEDAGTKALDQAKEQYAVLMQQSSLIDQQGVGTKALGAAAKDLIEWEQQLANIKTKQTLTADQKSLLAKADQITAVKTQSAEQEKLNALKKEELETSAKLLAFQESINNQLDLSQEGLSNQLAGVGMGREAQKRLQDDLKIRQDYQKQLAKLQRDYQNIVNPTSAQTDLYDKETQVLEDALGQRLRMQQDYYVALDRAQSDWTNGANAAWQDYVYEAGDIAGQTYDLFDNAFRGMEDALVDFVTSGKLSFKSLADSIIADIARILIRAKIVTPALNALLGGSGSGGVSGLLGSGGSGGGALNLQSAWDGISSAYSIGTSGFGQAVSAGWTAGEGFIGGIQGAFKAGAASLSSGVGSLFASSSGTMVNGVYQLGTSAAPATVDLISNTVTNSSTGAVTGTATGATTAAGTGLSAASAVMAGIGGAIQGYLKAGVKGAIAGAGGAVAGAYAGAAIGSVVPVIGTAIGGAIGAVVGGLFGSSLFGGDWVTKDQGFQLGVEGGDLESYAFKYQKKKGGLFSSNKKRTRLSALDPEMQAALDQTYAATLGSVVGLFDSLNVELNDGVLDGLNVAATKISTKGKTGEEIQEAITKWFGGVADSMVSAVDAATGAGLGGMSFEGLTSFVNNLYTANVGIATLGLKMLDFSVAGGFAAENLINMAGGIEALNTNLGSFYDNFTSDTQKTVDSLAGVRAQFVQMGVALPETEAAYKALLKQQDVSTEAGRTMLTILTANAQSAASAYAILNQRQSDYYGAFYSEAENTARTIAETTAQIKEMGVTLPDSRDGFRDMVEALDRTTVTGKAMYDTLMSVAGAAGTVFDALEATAKAAADAAAEAAKAAADAAAEAAKAAADLLNQGVTSSFSALQRAISAQQKAAQETYNATTASLNDMASTASSNISDLTSVGNDLSSALKALRGDSDEAVKMLQAQARATLQNALATARSGGSLSGFIGLSDALDTVSSNNTDLYGSMEDFARDQGRTANVIAELEGINGKQLTSAEATLKTLKDQIDLVKDQFDQQMDVYDQQLEFAQAQLDAINGTDNSIKSVVDAINAMNASVVAALGAIKFPASSNTPQNNGSIVDTLYQSVLGRSANDTTDAAGKAQWAAALQSGALSYADAAKAIAEAALAFSSVGYTGDVSQSTIASSKAAAQKYLDSIKGFATGGLISGPGTGTSDSILSRLSNGEYVMTADAVRMFGTGMLDQMNAGNLPAFAAGSGIRLIGSSSAEAVRSSSARYSSNSAAAAKIGSGNQQGVIDAIGALQNYLYMITKYSEQTASGIRRQNEMEEAA